MGNDVVLSLSGVTKKFREHLVLKHIDLQVNAGDVIGIVGVNGSGKTTLLKTIMGFMYPDKGTVQVKGKNVSPGMLGNLPDRVGALIEDPLFLPQFTGFQNLSLLASIRNEMKRDDIIKVMEQVGLHPFLKRTVRKYSLGMRQRLGIAQAIMENPVLVLFDEPTNGLDTEGVKRFHSIVHSMTQSGVSFIIVSHRTEDTSSLCKVTYRLEQGQLLPN
ncbi:ABC transporter ATP-binding protein [Paenibacillus popilliae]|uniref:ATPase component n=1 Tax=Paenibacillus popilliae ATCC 14706 TaxID=1212764 RepID=M9LI69_PAEPP|nr:ABC transporter ATP-binding protein [Paenibacillus popilliae]GAC42675.1 ATPase component [Paenibacillus popilliae ATCC 14706]